VCVRVGCQVSGEGHSLRVNLLAEAAYASPREVGQLLQVPIIMHRGLVHLQQHRKRGSIDMKQVGQLSVAAVRQGLP